MGRKKSRMPAVAPERELKSHVLQVARTPGEQEARCEPQPVQRVPFTIEKTAPEDGRRHRRGPYHRWRTARHSGIEPDNQQRHATRDPSPTPQGPQNEERARRDQSHVQTRDSQDVCDTCPREGRTDIVLQRASITQQHSLEHGSRCTGQVASNAHSHVPADRPDDARAQTDVACLDHVNQVATLDSGGSMDASPAQVGCVVEHTRVARRCGPFQRSLYLDPVPRPQIGCEIPKMNEHGAPRGPAIRPCPEEIDRDPRSLGTWLGSGQNSAPEWLDRISRQMRRGIERVLVSTQGPAKDNQPHHPMSRSRTVGPVNQPQNRDEPDGGGQRQEQRRRESRLLPQGDSETQKESGCESWASHRSPGTVQGSRRAETPLSGLPPGDRTENGFHSAPSHNQLFHIWLHLE